LAQLFSFFVPIEQPLGLNITIPLSTKKIIGRTILLLLSFGFGLLFLFSWSVLVAVVVSVPVAIPDHRLP
jgi:hypothetical protein